MKKSERDTIIFHFKDRFIDFNEQKENCPNVVVYQYIHWLYTQWDNGLINLAQYKSLIKLDILKV